MDETDSIRASELALFWATAKDVCATAGGIMMHIAMNEGMSVAVLTAEKLRQGEADIALKRERLAEAQAKRAAASKAAGGNEMQDTAAQDALATLVFRHADAAGDEIS